MALGRSFDVGRATWRLETGYQKTPNSKAARFTPNQILRKNKKKTQLEASISSRRMFSTDAKIEGCCLSSRRPRTLDHVESIISYHNHNQSSLARGVFFGAKTDGLVGVGQTNPRINSVIITGALVYFEWFVIQPCNPSRLH